MKIIKPIATLCLLILFFQQVKSQNIIAGAEISYKCTSTPGIFEITLILYRPCDVAALCVGNCGAACNQKLKVLGADGSFVNTQFDSANLTLVNVRDINPNPDCHIVKNLCTNMGCVAPGLYSPAYERYEFIGFVNVGPTSGIPSACCNIRLAWDNGIRDNRVNSINPSQTFYTDAIINRCHSILPCNSSPEIQSDAISSVCEGVPVTYANGLIDPDYDSLSFAFAPAMASFNNPVSYISPYSPNTPMPYSGSANADFPGGIHCDPFTGDIMFTPSLSLVQNFIGVVVIETKQWKIINGKYEVIGITRRDFDMTVLSDCPPNNSPRLVTNPVNESNKNTPKTTWEICSGQQLCFTVTAIDTDFIPPIISDTTYLSWNQTIAALGATFKPVYSPTTRALNGPREDTYQFCWTPQDNTVRSNPYYFSVQGKDNRCPYTGKVTRAFSVKVNKGSMLNDSISILKTDSGCGRFYFNLIHKNLNANQLKRFIDISLFPNDPTFSKGSITYRYSPNIAHIFNESGAYNIRYRAYDTVNEQKGCSPFITTSTIVNSSYNNPTKEIIETVSTSCFYKTDGKVNVKISSGLPPFMFSFNNGPFSIDTVFNNLAGGLYSLKIKDNAGCIKVIENIKVQNTPRVILEGILNADKSEFYAGDTVKYWVRLVDFANTSVKWNITNGTSLSAPGTDHITVKWNHGPCFIQAIAQNNGCFDTISQNLTITNVGLPELQTKLGLNVYPNPTKNSITISVQNLIENSWIYLYDLQGKLIEQQELKLTQQLNLEHLPHGIYMLKIGDWHGTIIRE